MTTAREELQMLLFKVAGTVCALPLSHLREVLRPLPWRPLAGVPEFILGLAVIRGQGTPVVDGATLLAGRPQQPGRFLLLRAGASQLALAVDEVLGIRDVPPGLMPQLPPLAEALPEAITRVGTLDGGLLVFLEAGRLVPAEVWPRLQEAAHP